MRSRVRYWLQNGAADTLNGTPGPQKIKTIITHMIQRFYVQGNTQNN